MFSDDLNFIRQKIENIKSAIFKPEGISAFNLPSNIVHTIVVDESYDVWFFTACNGLSRQDVDKPFYASLRYYQKGRQELLYTEGEALVSATFHHDTALVRFHILSAEYYGYRNAAQSNIRDMIRAIYYQLIDPSGLYKKFEFLEPAGAGSLA